MRTTTVKELGAELPIGFVSDKSKQLIKTFTLRPFRAKENRMMAIWREANVGANVSKLVLKFLSLVVEEAGGQFLTLNDKGDSTPEMMTKILDWSFSDVLYMYLWARVQVSKEMVISYGCPNTDCSLKEAEVRADLTSIEVSCVENLEECKFWVQLQDGFRLANGKRCRKLQLKPIPFRTTLLPGGTQGNVDDVLGYSQLREAVASVDGGGDHYILTDEELDEMSYMDQIILNAQAGKVTAGPKMRTTIKCDKCGHPIDRAIDWRYDNFFVHSIPVAHLMI